jgi:hypothetical protein
MIPVRDAGDDQTLEVIEHSVDGLGLARRRVRQRRRDLAGSNSRNDREALRVLEIVGHPRDDALRVLSELVRRDVTNEEGSVSFSGHLWYASR